MPVWRPAFQAVLRFCRGRRRDFVGLRLDPGVAAGLAYTAEKRMHAMISESGGRRPQPFVTGMSRRFDDIDHRPDEYNRKLDVIIARLDGFILAGKIMLGVHALLIAALVVAFGLLVTRTN